MIRSREECTGRVREVSRGRLGPAGVTSRVTAGAPQVPSLRQNFLWTVSGNVVYAGSQWAILSVLAKFGSAGMVGQFALGLAVTAPVFLLANLTLRSVQATTADGRYTFSDFLGLRLVTSTLALAVVAGIVLAAGYRGETGLVVLLVGLAKAVESVADVFYGFLQKHERMGRIARSMMVKGVLSLGSVAASVWLTGNILWGLAGMAAGWAALLLGFDARGVRRVARDATRHSLRPRWEWQTLWNLARLAFPLGVASAVVAFAYNVPRYWVAHSFGESELGIFAALSYFMVPGNMVVNALAESALPRLSAYRASNAAAFRSLVLRLAGIGALLGVTGVVVAAAFGPQLLTLLYRPEYAAHQGTFLVLAAGTGLGFVAWFFDSALTAARRYRVQMAISLAMLATMVVATAVAVPRYGMAGAAAALAAAMLVQLVLKAGAAVVGLRPLRQVAVLPE
jgi:O-antigen/teichoic acid export membrane protein